MDSRIHQVPTVNVPIHTVRANLFVTPCENFFTFQLGTNCRITEFHCLFYLWWRSTSQLGITTAQFAFAVTQIQFKVCVLLNT